MFTREKNDVELFCGTTNLPDKLKVWIQQYFIPFYFILQSYASLQLAQKLNQLAEANELME